MKERFAKQNKQFTEKIIYYEIVETVMGWVGIAGKEKGLIRLILPESSSEKVWEQLNLSFPFQEIWVEADGYYASLHYLKERIQAYFEGKPSDFSKEKIDLSGYTPFQRKVLLTTKEIPYGETRSYYWLAEQSGFPGAYRAVGQVMSINPLPLIIPCHRVIGSRGELTGFSARGGIELKRKMLALEGTIMAKKRR